MTLLAARRGHGDGATRRPRPSPRPRLRWRPRLPGSRCRCRRWRGRPRRGPPRPRRLIDALVRSSAPEGALSPALGWRPVAGSALVAGGEPPPAPLRAGAVALELPAPLEGSDTASLGLVPPPEELFGVAGAAGEALADGVVGAAPGGAGGFAAGGLGRRRCSRRCRAVASGAGATASFPAARWAGRCPAAEARSTPCPGRTTSLRPTLVAGLRLPAPRLL